MDILTSFSERLNELMFDKGYTTKTLHEETGIPISVINKYRQRKVAPSAETAVQLADLFACSVEYLLGRKEENHPQTFYACPPFGERLRFLLAHDHCSQYKLCKETKISASVLHYWLNGTHTPNLDNLIKLAKFFDCSVDFVLGREK